MTNCLANLEPLAMLFKNRIMSINNETIFFKQLISIGYLNSESLIIKIRNIESNEVPKRNNDDHIYIIKYEIITNFMKAKEVHS